MIDSSNQLPSHVAVDRNGSKKFHASHCDRRLLWSSRN